MTVKAKKKPTGKMPGSSFLLGWHILVAPTSQNARNAIPSHIDTSKTGSLHKLPGPEDASYKLAPSLSDIIRQELQRREFSTQNITSYLGRIKPLQRYDKAFRCLWAMSAWGDPRICLTPTSQAKFKSWLSSPHLRPNMLIQHFCLSLA
jgi:hypothetical protein